VVHGCVIEREPRSAVVIGTRTWHIGEPSIVCRCRLCFGLRSCMFSLPAWSARPVSEFRAPWVSQPFPPAKFRSISWTCSARVGALSPAAIDVISISGNSYGEALRPGQKAGSLRSPPAAPPLSLARGDGAWSDLCDLQSLDPTPLSVPADLVVCRLRAIVRRPGSGLERNRRIFLLAAGPGPPYSQGHVGSAGAKSPRTSTTARPIRMELLRRRARETWTRQRSTSLLVDVCSAKKKKKNSKQLRT